MAPYDQRDRHDVVDSAAAPDGPVAGYSSAGPPRPYSAPSTYSTTQRLAAPVGRSPRLNSLASVAVLCLLIGGAAGAGTWALVAH